MAFSRQSLKPEIQCVSAESTEHCMEEIQVHFNGLGRGELSVVPGTIPISHAYGVRAGRGSCDTLTEEGRRKDHSWLRTDLWSEKVPSLL